MSMDMMEFALGVVLEVISQAGETLGLNGAPVAVTIVDITGRTVAAVAMDGAMPICSELSRKKAFTAVHTLHETLDWEREGLNPTNFGHPDITCLGGGVPLIDKNGEILGGIGVSGRNSHISIGVVSCLLQDHELALVGARQFADGFES